MSQCFLSLDELCAGLIDTALQALQPGTHTIIEAHPDVYAHMLQQGWDKKPGVRENDISSACVWLVFLHMFCVCGLYLCFCMLGKDRVWSLARCHWYFFSSSFVLCFGCVVLLCACVVLCCRVVLFTLYVYYVFQRHWVRSTACSSIHSGNIMRTCENFTHTLTTYSNLKG